MKGLVQFINEALEKKDLMPIIKRMFAGFDFAKADDENVAGLLIDNFNEGDEYKAEAVDSGFVISKNGKPECNVAVFVSDKGYGVPTEESIKDADKKLGYFLLINKTGKGFKFVPYKDLVDVINTFGADDADRIKKAVRKL